MLNQKIVYRYSEAKPFQGFYIGDPIFVPVFDLTDHFHFVCARCKEISQVLSVIRDDSYANTPTIYFWLKCPICGAVGARKIYLEDQGKHFLAFPRTVELLAKNPREARPGIRKARK